MSGLLWWWQPLFPTEPCCRLAGTTPHVHGDGAHTKPAGWYANPDNPDQVVWFDGYRYRPETAR